jgi:hypothetical protein
MGCKNFGSLLRGMDESHTAGIVVYIDDHNMNGARLKR